MEENKNNLPIVSVDTVKASINIELTKMGTSFQAIQTKADSFVFNEDNKDAISEFIALCKKMLKAIDEAHKVGKAPWKERADAWDAGKKAMVTMLNGILEPTDLKFQKLCKEIEDKKAAALKEEARRKAIKDGINANLIQFSAKIASCETTKELLSVESAINLEKSPSRKAKYMEFHDEAVEKYDEVLIPIIKAQKEKIKEREELDRQIKEAEDANNPAKIDELNEKKDEILNEIEQNKVDVQQGAIFTQDTFEITPVEEILPDTKSRDNIKFEIVDLSVAAKKCPELLDVSIKFREAQKVAMTLKEAGTFKDKDEVIVNGIKFFIETKYK